MTGFFDEPPEIDRRRTMNGLQALVTGMLAGLLTTDFVALDVEIPTDEEGNYLPEFYVTGRNISTKLRVSIEVIEEGREVE